ncbi:MAG: heavy-metal-associated domain-containing protein [Nocardioidaceae bacterium]|nr:heavy-metal-associated domain-containing protein [Nocardioidaceae bacterium]NUS52771.1 heavy-metal-associated domain-containing protein [Nocardioidaceae bacterium]
MSFTETAPCVTVYEVDGMTCGHCSRAVTAEVSALSGVRRVEVDLIDGRVTVTSDAALARDAIRDAIEEAGYRLR